MTPALIQTLVGTAVVLLLGLLALRFRALSLSGFATAVPFGLVILIMGDWRWLTILLAFFGVATYFTKFKYDFKKGLDSAQEKGGARGWPNTVANGGVATATAIAEFAIGGDILSAAFLGAIATSAADTLGTEVGLLSKVHPRLITDLKRRVAPGTSGGITVVGEVMSLVGAVIIGVVAVLLGFPAGWALKVILICAAAGFLGSTIDSLLGATVQGLHKCGVCGRATENLVHHDQGTTTIKGVRFVDNNVVNLLATAAGAVIAMALFLLI